MNTELTKNLGNIIQIGSETGRFKRLDSARSTDNGLTPERNTFAETLEKKVSADRNRVENSNNTEKSELDHTNKENPQARKSIDPENENNDEKKVKPDQIIAIPAENMANIVDKNPDNPRKMYGLHIAETKITENGQIRQPKNIEFLFNKHTGQKPLIEPDANQNKPEILSGSIPAKQNPEKSPTEPADLSKIIDKNAVNPKEDISKQPENHLIPSGKTGEITENGIKTAEKPLKEGFVVLNETKPDGSKISETAGKIAQNLENGSNRPNSTPAEEIKTCDTGETNQKPTISEKNNQTDVPNDRPEKPQQNNITIKETESATEQIQTRPNLKENSNTNNPTQIDQAAASQQTSQTEASSITATRSPEPPANPTQQPNPIADQIHYTIAASVRQGSKEITIRLDPPELGRINARFEQDGNEVKAVLEVSRPQTREEIQNLLPQIMRNLQQAGIRVKHIDLVSDQQQFGKEGQSGSANDHQGDQSGTSDQNFSNSGRQSNGNSTNSDFSRTSNQSDHQKYTDNGFDLMF